MGTLSASSRSNATPSKSKVKASSPLNRQRQPRRGVQVWLYSSFNLGARCGGWSTPRPGRFTPRKYPVSILEEAGWAAGPVWTGVENLALTRIRSSNRPARNQSLRTGLSREAQNRRKRGNKVLLRNNVCPRPPIYVQLGTLSN
jgi:hypothetical protein